MAAHARCERLAATADDTRTCGSVQVSSVPCILPACVRVTTRGPRRKPGASSYTLTRVCLSLSHSLSTRKIWDASKDPLLSCRGFVVAAGRAVGGAA